MAESQTPRLTLKKLDEAVAALGEVAKQSYEEGRAKTGSAAREFDKQLAEAHDEAAKLTLRMNRRQLPNYVSFPFDDAVQGILAGLDR